MNPQDLLQRIEKLEKEIQSLKTAYMFPLDTERALISRGFLKTSAPLTVTAAQNFSATGTSSNSIYVATSSGGAVTHQVTVVGGLITAIA